MSSAIVSNATTQFMLAKPVSMKKGHCYKIRHEKLNGRNKNGYEIANLINMLVKFSSTKEQYNYEDSVSLELTRHNMKMFLSKDMNPDDYEPVFLSYGLKLIDCSDVKDNVSDSSLFRGFARFHKAVIRHKTTGRIHLQPVIQPELESDETVASNRFVQTYFSNCWLYKQASLLGTQWFWENAIARLKALPQ